jgi:GT2 family glycosyltransferase
MEEKIMNTQVDIIIISFAKDNALREVTERCVHSLISSEKNIIFNVILIESNKNEKYDLLKGIKNLKIVYPTVEFGYNRYLNIGLKLSHSEYVCLCNNDLIFSPGWASAIVDRMEKDSTLLSASPYSTNPHKTRFNLKIEDKIEYGYNIRRYLAGWCIFQSRKIYERIGLLDEKFIFWYADNDYSETIKKLGIKHALVLNSVVEHIESKTLNEKDSNTKQKLTIEQKKIFDLKWKNKR